MLNPLACYLGAAQSLPAAWLREQYAQAITKFETIGKAKQQFVAFVEENLDTAGFQAALLAKMLAKHAGEVLAPEGVGDEPEDDDEPEDPEPSSRPVHPPVHGAFFAQPPAAEIPLSSPLARYLGATRSLPAAWLLIRIAYWWPKAKLRYGPHVWIAKSAAEWGAETGLTPQQYKDAVAVLRQRDLIVTERHWFGSNLMTHLRLTAAGQTLLRGLGTPSAQGPETPTAQGPGAPTAQGLEAPAYTQGDTDKELLQEEDCVLAHATPAGVLEKDSEEDGKEAMKAKDVLEKIHKPQTHLGLETLWKAVIAEVYDGFVPEFTAKQRGQLKQFRAKCPEGEAARVLEFCLRHWLLFTEAAKSQGAFKMELTRFGGHLKA